MFKVYFQFLYGKFECVYAIKISLWMILQQYFSLVKLIIILMTSFVAILKTLISNTDCVIYILNKGDFFVTFSRIYTEIAAELWFCGLHWKFNFGETKQFLSVSYFQGIRIVQIVGCIYYVGHSMLSWRRILPRLDSK